MMSSNDIKNRDAENIYILKKLVNSFEFPLSVSYINIRSKNLLKRPFPIINSFMQRNKHLFKFLVVGNDLKILKHENITVGESDKDALNDESSIRRDFNVLYGAICKENALAVDIQNKMKNECKKFDDFLSYGSKKKPTNLPFIIRNSHIFKISSADEQTYVTTLSDWKNNITMNEEELWRMISSNEMYDFLYHVFKNLLADFFEPIDQGTLQSCFNFGTILVDKDFTSRYRVSLEKSDKGILLTSESRHEVLKRKQEESDVLSGKIVKRMKADSSSQKRDDVSTKNYDELPEKNVPVMIDGKAESMLTDDDDDIDEETEKDLLAEENERQEIDIVDMTTTETTAGLTEQNTENPSEHLSWLSKTVETAVLAQKSVIIVGKANTETVIVNLSEDDPHENIKQKWNILDSLIKSLRDQQS